MGELEQAIRKFIVEEVHRALEAKLLDYMRTLGLEEVVDEPPNLVGAEEVARILGYDTSTPEKTRQSVNKVYSLASRNLLPSVRISPRRVRFNPVKVREVLEKGGNADPYSRP